LSIIVFLACATKHSLFYFFVLSLPDGRSGKHYSPLTLLFLPSLPFHNSGVDPFPLLVKRGLLPHQYRSIVPSVATLGSREQVGHLQFQPHLHPSTYFLYKALVRKYIPYYDDNCNHAQFCLSFLAMLSSTHSSLSHNYFLT
jgi:hypothetical protein